MPNYILEVVSEGVNRFFYGPYDYDTAIEKGKDWTDNTHFVTLHPIVTDR